MIHRTPFFLPWLYPQLTWKIPSQDNELFLTFDDGPVPGPTEYVLDTLARYSAKATFFCIGDNIRKHPEVFSKIVEDGHTIGNHTFNHLNGWMTSTEKYLKNIQQCEKEFSSFKNVTQGQTKLFRPPYGRITRKQIRALSDYKIMMWNVLSVDYNKNLRPELCLWNTVKATTPGSVIVFHDSYKASKNMAFTLPRFIEHFISKGFVFKAIS